MKDIIIVSQAPLTPQILRNNYIAQFQDLGHRVLFWDLSQLIHPGMRFADELQLDICNRINSLDELKKSLKSTKNSDTVYIFDFDANWQRREIFKLFSLYNAKMIRVDMYANTSLYLPRFKRLKQLLSRNGLGKIKLKLSAYIYSLYKRINHITGFTNFASSSNFVRRDIKINHPDYDDFVFFKPVNPIEKKFFVFVDTFFGKHPDAKYFYGYEKPVNIEKYYNSLKAFFDYIEQKYGIPVIIAAHPKASYTTEFGNRKILKYKTKDLIYYAEGVILQVCNTMSWVALADKPAVLITCKEYDKFNDIRGRFRSYAQSVGLPIFNIDSMPFEEIKFQNIDTSHRHEYIFGYLTSEDTKNTPNQITLSNEIEKLV